MSRPSWLWIAALVCLGSALRLAWVEQIQPAPTHDAKWYESRARSFAAGNGVSVSSRPTAYRPIGYPVLLGAAYSVFGVDDNVHRYVNVALGAMALLGLYIVTLRTTRSRVAACFATLLYACYPADIAYTSLAVSEPLFNTCMLLGVAAWSLERWALAVVLSGIALFAAAMTRAAGVLVPVLVAVLAPLPLHSSTRQRLLRGIAMMAVFLLLMVPFWIRNERAFGGFVAVANNGGVNLYIGNNPRATGGYRFDRAVTAQLPRDLDLGWLGSGGPREYQIDRTLNELARQYILDHPRETVALVPAKLKALYFKDHTAFEWSRARGTDLGEWFGQAYKLDRDYYLGLWVLALIASLGLVSGHLRRWTQATIAVCLAVGFAAAGVSTWIVASCLLLFASCLIRRSRSVCDAPWLAYACVAAFTGLQVVYFGDARFHHAMMPWACVAAGTWFSLLFERLPRIAGPSHGSAPGTSAEPATSPPMSY